MGKANGERRPGVGVVQSRPSARMPYKSESPMFENDQIFDNPGRSAVVRGEQFAGWSQRDVNEFVIACDRLVRHLFTAGLRLRLRRNGSEAVADDLTVVLDDLDALIRDTGMAMLPLVEFFGSFAAEPPRHRER